MEKETRDNFLRGLKEEWKLLWRERFDDRVSAEGVAVRDYPLVLVERGCVIFAVRNAKTPSFSDVVNHWATQGKVYATNPSSGGWRKFARTHLKKPTTDKEFKEKQIRRDKQQLKKGGRGWLHK